MKRRKAKISIYLFLMITFALLGFYRETWIPGQIKVHPLWEYFSEVFFVTAIMTSTLFFTKISAFFIENVVPEKSFHPVKKFWTYFVWVIVLLGIVFRLVMGFGGDVALSFGLIGAGLAFAMQRPLMSLVGWVVLLTNQIYKEGDRIEVNNIKGDVADVGIMNTRLLEFGGWAGGDQSTGRMVNIPNSWILEKKIINYTRDFNHIWDEVTVRIPYDSNWKKANDILEKIGKDTMLKSSMLEENFNRIFMDYGVQRNLDGMTLDPKVFMNFKDSWIEMRLRYLTETGKRRSTQTNICRKILEEFQKAKIKITYPTIRLAKAPTRVS